MRRRIAFLLGLCLAAGLQAQEPAVAPPPPDDLLAAAQELGRINGLALACKHAEVAARIKSIMVSRMPRTRTYGDAFDAATSAAFLNTPGGCPDAALLNVQAEMAAARLPQAER